MLIRGNGVVDVMFFVTKMIIDNDRYGSFRWLCLLLTCILLHNTMTTTMNMFPLIMSVDVIVMLIIRLIFIFLMMIEMICMTVSFSMLVLQLNVG
jgi:hypothetical protein